MSPRENSITRSVVETSYNGRRGLCGTTEITIQVDLINSMDIKPIRYILLHPVIDTEEGRPIPDGRGALGRIFFSVFVFS